MLASVYSYRVMVKSESSCCVRGRRVLSNPVTIYLLHRFYVRGKVSEEFDRETTIDTFLLYDRPIIRRRKAVDRIKAWF